MRIICWKRDDTVLEGLLEKSKHNIETANFAENNKFYDAALSRYYYAVYEKIIYISKKKNFYKKPSSGKDSHIFTINTFTQNVTKDLEPEDITTLASLIKLKKMRADADYDDKEIPNLNTFNLKFKYFYNQINEVLDKLI